MVLDPVLGWVESTAFSVWMRESPSVWAFPAILSCHTVGMGLVAGINAALALRILGVAPGVPIAEMKRFFPIMWFGFWLNFVSGIALLIAYPTKALTNPLFYFKLFLVAVAITLVKPITRRVFVDQTVAVGAGTVRLKADTAYDIDPTYELPKRLAVASLLCWAGVIVSGRLLAYTYTRLLQGF